MPVVETLLTLVFAAMPVPLTLMPTVIAAVGFVTAMTVVLGAETDCAVTVAVDESAWVSVKLVPTGIATGLLTVMVFAELFLLSTVVPAGMPVPEIVSPAITCPMPVPAISTTV